MDEKTHRYYHEHAEDLAARWSAASGGVSRYFRAAFPEGGKILEIGSGSGRDLASLVREGYEPVGLEPVEDLADAARRRFPHVAAHVRVGELPDHMPSLTSLGGPFDGVLCAAVLHHLPRAQLFRSVFAIRDLMVEGGRLLLSIRRDPPLVDAHGHDGDGRFDNGVRSGELQLLCERAGLASLSRWQTGDSLGRTDRHWVTLLFQRRGASAGQPLAQIEGVLSRDRKVATYKLALLRALTDIALTQSHRVDWLDGDQVAVPLRAIAERWILYYWPLFEAGTFLPQMQGEWRSRAHRVGFARELTRLIERSRKRGGLTGYAVRARSGDFDTRERVLVTALIRKLTTVIRAGPVTYAGGSLETGRLFSARRGQVIVAGSLWRELALMAYWVQDALVLRWAQLIRRLSHGEVPVERAMPALLLQPSPERETQAARSVFEALPVRRCVWSGQELKKRFDVDHVIPYAHWRNNDLWNLVPTHPSVNLSKRDRLPATSLLLRRRDSLRECWDQLRSGLPERFDREVEAFAGRELGSSLDSLFELVLESVEATAVQRHAERFDLQ